MKQHSTVTQLEPVINHALLPAINDPTSSNFTTLNDTDNINTKSLSQKEASLIRVKKCIESSLYRILQDISNEHYLITQINSSQGINDNIKKYFDELLQNPDRLKIILDLPTLNSDKILHTKLYSMIIQNEEIPDESIEYLANLVLISDNIDRLLNINLLDDDSQATGYTPSLSNYSYDEASTLVDYPYYNSLYSYPTSTYTEDTHNDLDILKKIQKGLESTIGNIAYDYNLTYHTNQYNAIEKYFYEVFKNLTKLKKYCNIPMLKEDKIELFLMSSQNKEIPYKSQQYLASLLDDDDRNYIFNKLESEQEENMDYYSQLLNYNPLLDDTSSISSLSGDSDLSDFKHEV